MGSSPPKTPIPAGHVPRREEWLLKVHFETDPFLTYQLGGGSCVAGPMGTCVNS